MVKVDVESVHHGTNRNRRSKNKNRLAQGHCGIFSRAVTYSSLYGVSDFIQLRHVCL